ncbi:MAG: lysoplasmalogenase [Clostridia bacterium]|nr:lysoplasmalogenase [Clostridia bacterium]
MKRIYGILNAILIAATLVSCIVYDRLGGLGLKALTASGFVMLGAVNAVYAMRAKTHSRKFPTVMALGLLVCMIGDVVLNIWFIPGALIFAVGHLFYFAAYCCRMRFAKKDLLPSAILFAASALIITAVPIFDFGSPLMKGICLVYAFVISCMVGKALANLFREQSAVTVLTAVGSILFYVSDFMLLLNIFAGAPPITDTLCLFTYFPAQCLLAHAIYRYVNSKE